MTINFVCVEGTDYGATEFTKGSGGKFVWNIKLFRR